MGIFIMKHSKKYTILRVCASCEWIFKSKDPTCPKCQFGSYGAYYVYGNSAYRLAISQRYWKERKIHKYSRELDKIINDNNNDNKPKIKTQSIQLELRKLI